MGEDFNSYKQRSASHEAHKGLVSSKHKHILTYQSNNHKQNLYKKHEKYIINPIDSTIRENDPFSIWHFDRFNIEKNKKSSSCNKAFFIKSNLYNPITHSVMSS